MKWTTTRVGSPSNYISRTQSHLNIAEFDGDKHEPHGSGSHLPSTKRDFAVKRQRGRIIPTNLMLRDLHVKRYEFSDMREREREKTPRIGNTVPTSKKYYSYFIENDKSSRRNRGSISAKSNLCQDEIRDSESSLIHR